MVRNTRQFAEHTEKVRTQTREVKSEEESRKEVVQKWERACERGPERRAWLDGN